MSRYRWKKTTGDSVVGGAINGNGTLLIRVTAVGDESFLHQVISSVEDARARGAVGGEARLVLARCAAVGEGAHERGEVILAAGEASRSLFLILDGSVSVIVQDEEDEGHKMVVSYLNPGEFFGEMGLFE